MKKPSINNLNSLFNKWYEKNYITIFYFALIGFCIYIFFKSFATPTPVYLIQDLNNCSQLENIKFNGTININLTIDCNTTINANNNTFKINNCSYNELEFINKTFYNYTLNCKNENIQKSQKIQANINI